MRHVVFALALVACGGKAKDDGLIKAPILDEQKPDPKPVEAEPVETKREDPPAVVPEEPVSAAVLELPAKPSGKGSQNQIAWMSASEGIDFAKQGKWNDASSKFRDAVARVPLAPYFYNLCVTLYQEAKLGEAMTACDAVGKQEPTAKLQAKTDQMIARIKKLNP